MPNIRHNMQTFDEVITENVKDFIDRSAQANKPFFVWMNPTRMHVITHLSPQYQAARTGQNGWYEYEAGMKQLDDNVGAVMEHLTAARARRQHHRRLHHRQRRGELHLAGRRQHALRRQQGHGARGRLPRAVYHPLAR